MKFWTLLQCSQDSATGLHLELYTPPCYLTGYSFKALFGPIILLKGERVSKVAHKGYCIFAYISFPIYLLGFPLIVCWFLSFFDERRLLRKCRFGSLYVKYVGRSLEGMYHCHLCSCWFLGQDRHKDIMTWNHVHNKGKHLKVTCSHSLDYPVDVPAIIVFFP